MSSNCWRHTSKPEKVSFVSQEALLSSKTFVRKGSVSYCQKTSSLVELSDVRIALVPPYTDALIGLRKKIMKTENN